MTKPNYVQIRSFLAANLDVLLDNLGQRRNDNKIDSDDLFFISEIVKPDTIAYVTEIPIISKLDVLLKEKEALGLYVSGNPLEDYAKLATWAKEISYNDNVHLVVLNKTRKIFTKKGLMMFVLELSTPDGEYEGIIFPKKAMEFSTVLVDKELFFVKGKLDQKDETTVSKLSETGEVQEYDELPKILIDMIVPFEAGLPALLGDDEATSTSPTFQRNVEGLDWQQLKFNPGLLFADSNEIENQPKQTEQIEEHMEQIPAEDDNPKIIKLSRSLGIDTIKDIKSSLQKSKQPGLIKVIIEIETNEGFKRAKGEYYLDSQKITHLSLG
jgi:hypothetical protein